MPSTKIEAGFNRIARLSGLDDLARLLFPGNGRHQKVFILIFCELKYAEGRFLPSFSHLPVEYQISPRLLETVRAKCRRLGLIDHVCRFNRSHGYREGWVFSSRFPRALAALSRSWQSFLNAQGPNQRAKDRDTVHYL